MNPSMRFFLKAPYPVKCAAASLWGLHLKNMRYGRDTESLVAAALEREFWPRQKWTEWQTERLRFILSRAVTTVPYYREYWRGRGQLSDKSVWGELGNWPVLEKEEINKCPEAFVAEDKRKRFMYHEHTGGTTGKPLDLWWSYRTVRLWYALFEARWKRWYGVSLADRWAIIGGQMVTSIDRMKPPFWVLNHASGQLYLSAYHIRKSNTRAYFDALRRHDARYLVTYTSAVHSLAQFGAEEGLIPPAFKVIITNAEPLVAEQRKKIEEFFQCPVRETYGMSELTAAAGECSQGSLHLWPEAGIVEVFKGGQSAGAEQEGKLVTTGLFNQDMPLIRYAVGDRGVIANQDESCACGRSLPILKGICGRNHDLIVTPDGRELWYLNPVFSKLPIQEFQVIQVAKSLLRVLVVMPGSLNAEQIRTISQGVQSRVGAMEVQVEQVPGIEREKNGKFRAVKNLLSARSAGGKGAELL